MEIFPHQFVNTPGASSFRVTDLQLTSLSYQTHHSLIPICHVSLWTAVFKLRPTSAPVLGQSDRSLKSNLSSLWVSVNGLQPLFKWGQRRRADSSWVFKHHKRKWKSSWMWSYHNISIMFISGLYCKHCVYCSLLKWLNYSWDTNVVRLLWHFWDLFNTQILDG